MLALCVPKMAKQLLHAPEEFSKQFPWKVELPNLTEYWVARRREIEEKEEKVRLQAKIEAAKEQRRLRARKEVKPLTEEELIAFVRKNKHRIKTLLEVAFGD